jgi:D-serine deaminase-like pyridoxal phosphate-dependent protein
MIKSKAMTAFTKPTLVLDEARVRRNIARMAARAARFGVRFRPHFKTHQSRAVGRIFREFGVEAITVSSVDMAAYFADDGWRDILIAFPFNVLEARELADLAARCRLGVLVESKEGFSAAARAVPSALDVWIKVNVGANRAGADWDDLRLLGAICREAERHPTLRLRGLLTHNGRTYTARTPAALARVHADAMRKMRRARAELAAAGFSGLEISVGDTPACSRLDDFAGADEIRPGNFVLFDVTQIELGACGEKDVAAAVACPIVSLHPARNEAVIFGGAIHLSMADAPTRHEGRLYGRVCRPSKHGWGRILPGTAVHALSQEHGIVKTTAAGIKKLKAGDILIVLPVHSCLTVNLWSHYVGLDGKRWPTIRDSNG